MIIHPKVRTVAQARKRLAKLEARSSANLYREPPPDRVPPPITLPAVSTREITDEMIGLKPDPVAQQRAETYLKAVLGYQTWAAATAKPPIGAPTVVNVEVPDDSLSLSDDAAILSELRRIKAMPTPRWMKPKPGRLAS